MRKILACALALTCVAVEAQERYRLDAQFNAIANYYIQDDVSEFTKGSDTLLGDALGVVNATAKEVAKTYKDNEVAGDQKYLRKKILVSGSISSIRSGLGNTPYLVFNESGIIGAQAHFDKEQVPRVAQLKKNEKITLVCMGGGSVAGTPMFKDCFFATDYISKYGTEIVKDINKFSKGESVSPIATRLSVIFEAIARNIPNNVDCSKGCEKEMSKASPGKEKTKKIIMDMRAGGLKISPEVEKQILEPAKKA